MFQGVLQGDLWSLKLARQLVPLIEEEEAVESIFGAITSGKKVLVYCLAGWRAWVFPWIPPLTRLLPVDVYNYLVCISGGRDGMNAFVGRTKKEN
ncbi:Rxlr-like protein [Globisporangium polare]